MWNYSFKFVSGATSSSFFLKSICRWLSEGCISGQGDHIAKKIYLMHPAAFLLSIYGRASLVLDSVCFNFTVQLLKKSLLALYCESWKAWLWWIRPYVRSLLQASPGSKPHLFDLFLSVYFFFPIKAHSAVSVLFQLADLLGCSHSHCSGYLWHCRYLTCTQVHR